MFEPEEPVLAMESLLREPLSPWCSALLVGCPPCSFRGRRSEVSELTYLWKSAPCGVGYTGWFWKGGEKVEQVCLCKYIGVMEEFD